MLIFIDFDVFGHFNSWAIKDVTFSVRLWCIWSFEFQAIKDVHVYLFWLCFRTWHVIRSWKLCRSANVNLLLFRYYHIRNEDLWTFFLRIFFLCHYLLGLVFFLDLWFLPYKQIFPWFYRLGKVSHSYLNFLLAFQQQLLTWSLIRFICSMKLYVLV